MKWAIIRWAQEGPWVLSFRFEGREQAEKACVNLQKKHGDTFTVIEVPEGEK
jgi:hypothetical protein